MALNKRTGIIAGGMTALAAAGVTMFMLLAGPIRVAPGEDLQAAINSAPCGSVIELQAGAVYPANITLPKKDCVDYLVIQSSRVGELPAGKRVNPFTQSALLAQLQGVVTAEPIVKTAAGAHHYRLDGLLAKTANESMTTYDVIRLGDGRQVQNTPESVPHHISIDRSAIQGFANQEVQRGVSLQCADCEVTNSYISDIHMEGVEAQGIAGWNGPGPFKIINNYIEASTQGVLFGGADPASQALSPARAEIRRNHLFKPLSWKVGHPTYAGKHWTVKNILELKNMKDAVIDGNMFENNWTDGQDGKAILFTVRNQECTANYSTVQNVTYSNNTLINAEGGLNLLGKDNEAEPAFGKCPAGSTSVRGSNITIGNNLFHNINGSLITSNGFSDVTAQNNTSLQQGSLVTFYGEVSERFKLLNHLTVDHDYSIFGDGGTMGKAALDKFAPGWAMANCVIGAPRDGSNYPPNNQYPASLTSLPADFRSPFPGIGTDMDKLMAAQAGSGVSVPLPSPSATVPSPTVPSPSPSSTVAPPSPSPTSSPTPKPSPTPCVPKVVPLCRSGQVVGNPPQCLCRAGMRGAMCK